MRVVVNMYLRDSSGELQPALENASRAMGDQYCLGRHDDLWRFLSSSYELGELGEHHLSSCFVGRSDINQRRSVACARLFLFDRALTS